MLESLEGVVAPNASARFEPLGGFGTHYAVVISSSFFRARNRFTSAHVAYSRLAFLAMPR